MKNFTMWFITLIMAAAFMTGCGSDSSSNETVVTDIIAPTVLSSIPAEGAVNVAINSKVAVIFSEKMNPATITAATFSLKKLTTSVPGTVAYVDNGAVFTPSSDLDINSLYVATITIAVKDLAGNAMEAEKIITFETGATADNTAPTVITTVPVDTDTGIALDADITANFSEGIDPATVLTRFTLKQGTTVIPGNVTYLGSVATFNPTADLATNKVYTATIAAGVKDLAGNALAAAKVWSFTSRTAVALGPMPVDLGLAGNYAILAETMIASAENAKTIVGDLGISPNFQASITGFALVTHSTGDYSESVYVTGKIYAPDNVGGGAGALGTTPANLTTAITNMTDAYTDGAGRTVTNPPGVVNNINGGELGSQNLVPGIYKFDGAVTINTDLILTTTGAEDVWIFQIAGGLDLAAGKIISLGGNAKAKNIFWITGSAVTIGTGAEFKGIVMSQTAITIGDNAVVVGRLLAQSAVNLGTGLDITTPAP